MQLDIQQAEKEGIIILALKGRLVLGPEDFSLREHIASLLSGGHRQVIVNLKEVSKIDSAGLGTLVLCADRFRSAGGKLVLINLNPAHENLASLLHMETEIEVHRDEQDAINSFFPDRAVPHYDLLELVEELKTRRGAGQQAEKK